MRDGGPCGTAVRALAGRVGVERRRRLAQLVAICDVYTWKLLRRDQGLSRERTAAAIRHMVQAILDRRQA